MTDPALRIGAGAVVADRYQLVRPIGSGGVGDVWLANDRRLQTSCALKLLRKDGLLSDEARQRFGREARLAAQMRSPNVVQIFDQGEHLGVPFIAMELLLGEDLAARLKRVRRLSVAETLVIATQIARALTKAHELGLVHRDLKPANVFLAKDGEVETVKVLDFGLAKNLLLGAPMSAREGAASDALASATRTGALLGTPNYMSPEQIEGTREVDTRSDLWSFATLIYECLTGRLPFENEDVVRLFVLIQLGPIPVPSMVAPHLPRDFDDWFARASARDRNARFQTAREMMDDLARALGGAAQVPAARDAVSGFDKTAAFSPLPQELRGEVDANLVSAPTIGVVVAPLKPLQGAARGTSRPLWIALGLFLVVGMAGAAVALFVWFNDPGKRSKSAPSTSVAVIDPLPSVSSTRLLPGDCSATGECPNPLQDVCDYFPPICKPSATGAILRMNYQHGSDRWNGGARYAKTTLDLHLDQIRMDLVFGKDNLTQATFGIILNHTAPGETSFKSDGSRVGISLNDRGASSAAYNGAYKQVAGILNVTSLDNRFGGHFDGTLQADMQGGSDKDPVHAFFKLTFHVDFDK